MVTVPSPLTRPVRLRRPSVAGSGYGAWPGPFDTWYVTPRSRPACSVYARFQVVPSNTHFCSPDNGSLPALAIVPSPSSPTYSVVAFANQMPKGKRGSGAVTLLARPVYSPGRIVMGTFLRRPPGAFAAVGSGPATPTRYTLLTPLPPLPLVTNSVWLKIVSPRKLLSLPALSGGKPRDVTEKLPIMSMF